jgi:hypothetical protein
MATTRRLTMPTELTPAMRAAAGAVPPSITLNDPPYLDRLWQALVEEVRKEQGEEKP